MPKRSSKRKDFNEIAASIVAEATEPAKADKKSLCRSPWQARWFEGW